MISSAKTHFTNRSADGLIEADRERIEVLVFAATQHNVDVFSFRGDGDTTDRLNVAYGCFPVLDEFGQVGKRLGIGLRSPVLGFVYVG